MAKVAGPLTATGGRWWEAFGSLEGFETLNGVVSHRCCRRVLYRLASGGGGEVESSSPGRRASDAAKRRRVFT